MAANKEYPIISTGELQDERGDGVHLLWQSDDGDRKATCADHVSYWFVVEWELIDRQDHIDAKLDPFWMDRSTFMIDKTLVEQLYKLQQEASK